jgi:hypothetical protein
MRTEIYVGLSQLAIVYVKKGQVDSASKGREAGCDLPRAVHGPLHVDKDGQFLQSVFFLSDNGLLRYRFHLQLERHW